MAQQWRARLSALLTVAAILLGSARAGKGPPMSTLEVVHSVEHLEEIIFSDRVSVILFTEGEDDTEESVRDTVTAVVACRSGVSPVIFTAERLFLNKRTTARVFKNII